MCCRCRCGLARLQVDIDAITNAATGYLFHRSELRRSCGLSRLNHDPTPFRTAQQVPQCLVKPRRCCSANAVWRGRSQQSRETRA